MSDYYKFAIPDVAITFEADRLRRDHQELTGELIVRCGLPSAMTNNGVLSTGDFNFSSVRARQDRAKLLKERARTNGDCDWFGFLEEFCQRVFEAERTGDPDVDLRTLPRPEPADDIYVDGLVFPKRHPAILFGDGGAAKSYTALYIAGVLAQRGIGVGLFDWELSGEDHRDRLERLFGPNMPEVRYVRCERPLVSEADRLRRVARDRNIQYAIFDSIAFACNGRPEDAEIAGQYFRAVRQIGVGSLHIAHVNKSEENDKKPFGSSFWHNGARSTWNAQTAEPGADGLRLAFFHRKSNLGPLRAPVSFAVSFTSDRTIFRRADVADTPEFAKRMSVRQQLRAILSRGARTFTDIEAEIDADAETVKRTIRRYKDDFIVLEGGRVGLTEKSA